MSPDKFLETVVIDRHCIVIRCQFYASVLITMNQRRIAYFSSHRCKKNVDSKNRKNVKNAFFMKTKNVKKRLVKKFGKINTIIQTKMKKI